MISKTRKSVSFRTGVFEKCVCSPRARTKAFIYLLRPGRDKTFSQALLEDFVPSSCGQPPVSASAQAYPVRCPQHGKRCRRCRRKQGVIPSCAYGRRRYNTLDLASKIVCHGADRAPLDSPGFRRLCGQMYYICAGSGNSKSSIFHPQTWMKVGAFCRASVFAFSGSRRRTKPKKTRIAAVGRGSMSCRRSSRFREQKTEAAF